MNSREEEERQYIDSLDSKEKQAYEIAKSHLGSSFHIIKSNGFIKWKKRPSNVTEGVQSKTP